MAQGIDPEFKIQYWGKKKKKERKKKTYKKKLNIVITLHQKRLE
jgi:hypothetical protein